MCQLTGLRTIAQESHSDSDSVCTKGLGLGSAKPQRTRLSHRYVF